MYLCFPNFFTIFATKFFHKFSPNSSALYDNDRWSHTCACRVVLIFLLLWAKCKCGFFIFCLKHLFFQDLKKNVQRKHVFGHIIVTWWISLWHSRDIYARQLPPWHSSMEIYRMSAKMYEIMFLVVISLKCSNITHDRYIQ